ncbi:SGNH/GDSL hydrolase family protein [Streptomyces sp. NPDC050988]|uniref:SGNH/GDSL hydrolase family protein n=1 Tax=Streptomyces sp. NPDC050988 TaxID=3365637 RepID=UPI0037A3EEBA
MALSTVPAVSASAAVPAPRTVDYVELGDSYGSGPRYSLLVDPACVRSDQNHPSLLAAVENWQLTGSSCGGATTVALTGPQGTKSPQLDALDADMDVVTLVSHPDLFPDDGVGRTSSLVPLAAGDFAHLRDTEKRFNARPASQARARSVRYVDTYTATIGHDMCKPAKERWIEPPVVVAPAAGSHPNAQGRQAMATAVQRALRCVTHHR